MFPLYFVSTFFLTNYQISPILFFTVAYFAIAQYFRGVLKIHSIVHCVSAVLLNSYILFYTTGIHIFTTSFCSLSQQVNISALYFPAYNSLGYFIADSIDIFLDWKNVKRRVFLIHHFSAILGILTIFAGSKLVNYAVWSLEIGGIVHHLKHASEIYQYRQIPAYTLYFLVYTTSRVLLFLNCNYCLTIPLSYSEIFGILISYLLILQNVVWIYQNLKKLIF